MMDQLMQKLETWGQELVLLLPNLAVAVLIVTGAWLISVVAGKGIDRVMRRISDHRALNDLVRKLVRVAIVTAGFLIALNVLKLDEAAATFLAGAGIVGLALGFAFQDLSANFISGVAMAVRRPMHTGDLIETNDHIGIIERIELRSSSLRTLDGKLIIIPNRHIFENALINHTRLGKRRVDIDVGVSYGDDLDKAMRAAVGAVEGVQPRLERDVELFYKEFGDSSINFQLRFWIEFRQQVDYLSARHKAVMAIKKAFDENDITIPFPIRTLDFGIVGGEKLKEHLAEWSNGHDRKVA